jgi:hypothetical protein
MTKDGYATLYLFDKNSIEFLMGKAARAFGDGHRFAGNLFAAGVLPAIDSPRQILAARKIFVVYLLLVFGFDIGEPAGVNIRNTFYICNNINDFDSWTSGKLGLRSSGIGQIRGLI